MRLRAVRQSHLLPVDLTPMIDVVLQLIIFFMFTSQLGQIARTEVDLPRQPGVEQEERVRPAVSIDLHTDGSIYYESRRVSLNEMSAIVSRELARFDDPAGFVVLVRPAQDAPATALDRLATRLSDAGVERWRLASVDPAQAGGAR